MLRNCGDSLADGSDRHGGCWQWWELGTWVLGCWLHSQSTSRAVPCKLQSVHITWGSYWSLSIRFSNRFRYTLSNEALSPGSKNRGPPTCRLVLSIKFYRNRIYLFISQPWLFSVLRSCDKRSISRKAPNITDQPSCSENVSPSTLQWSSISFLFSSVFHVAQVSLGLLM